VAVLENWVSTPSGLDTVNEILWIQPTDALNSSFIGITTVHVSGSLSAHHQEFLAYIGFGTFYAVVMKLLLPGVGWHASSILLLTQKIGIFIITAVNLTKSITKKYYFWDFRFSRLWIRMLRLLWCDAMQFVRSWPTCHSTLLSQ